MLSSCKICGNKFGTNAALVSHTKWKHGPPRKHECPICHVAFRDSFGVKRHVQGVHSSSHVERTTACPLCNYSASKKAMKTHFRDVHDINIVEETLMFNNVDDFKSWKGTMESDTHVKFVKHRASKTMKDGTTTSYFYCYKDGQSKSYGKGLRTSRKVWSNKMNAYCPASLKVLEFNKHVIVLFIKTHVGHSCDLVMTETEEVIEEKGFIQLDETKEGIVKDCVFNELQVGHNDEVCTTVNENNCDIDEVCTAVNENNCNIDDVFTTVNGNNCDIDEVFTTVNENNCDIDSFSNGTENVTVVIEVPNSSDDDLLNKKQRELEKIIEIMNSITTNEGLEAFKQHVAPLQSIVNDAENKLCSMISIRVLEENDGHEQLINNSYNEQDIIQTIQILDTESLRDVPEEVQLSDEVILPDYKL